MARRGLFARGALLVLLALGAAADEDVDCPWGNPGFVVADDAECPKKSEVPGLRKCHHDCLCFGEYCLGRNKCGANKLSEPNCHGESVYRVTRVPEPDTVAGVAMAAECPACEPVKKCPIVRKLRPEECAIVDEDEGRDDEPCIRAENRHLEVGEVCFAGKKVRETCELPRQPGVCKDPDAFDFVVTNVGGGCPSLERVKPDECPDLDAEVLKDCHDECVCPGDFCLGGGAKKCGAASDLRNCDGESVYYVTSTALVARDVDACEPCSGCRDDPLFIYGALENPRHTCTGPEGVAEDPEVRCANKEDYDGRSANEACPVTCGTCYTQPTPRPTAYKPTARPNEDDEFPNRYAPTPRPANTKRPTPKPTIKPTFRPTYSRVDDDALPTPRPTLPCPLLRPITPSECPEEVNIGNCDEPGLPVGALCEGDGECGTDKKLDNCELADMYAVVEGTTLFPTPKETPKPTPVIVSPGCPIIAAAAPEQCPRELDLVNCDSPGLKPGMFCEGDGECGTDRKLDNCDNAAVTGADIYFVVDAYQPTIAPTAVWGVRTSLRFYAKEIKERIPDYARSQRTADQVARALVKAGVALENHVYAVTFRDAGEDYKGDEAVAAIADLGFPDVEATGLTDLDRADMAAYVGRAVAAAARGDTAPSLARALSNQDKQLVKSFDAEATETYALDDSLEEKTPTPRPTSQKSNKKKKKDDELIEGVDEAGAVVIILLLVLLGCLIIGALVMWCLSGSSGSKGVRTESWDDGEHEVELSGKQPYRDRHPARDPHTSTNPMVYPKDTEGDLEDVDMAY